MSGLSRAMALPIVLMLAACNPNREEATSKACLFVAQQLAGDDRLHEWPAKSVQITSMSDGSVQTLVKLGSPPPGVVQEIHGGEIPANAYVSCFFSARPDGNRPKLSIVTSWRGEADSAGIAEFNQELSKFRFIGPWMIRK